MLTYITLVIMPRINIELDKVLHKALKKKAIDEEIDMDDAVVKAIESYVGENKDGLR